MTSKVSGKRDNSYYLGRLEREAPEIHKDLLAGKFESPAAAFRAAGLRGRRTRLSELMNAWNKATPAEQRAFMLRLGSAPISMPAAVPAPSPAGAPAALGHPAGAHAVHTGAGDYLKAGAKRKIETIMANRSLKMGQVMTAMGFASLNPSLGSALARGTRIQPDLARALDKWISDNSGYIE